MAKDNVADALAAAMGGTIVTGNPDEIIETTETTNPDTTTDEGNQGGDGKKEVGSGDGTGAAASAGAGATAKSEKKLPDTKPVTGTDTSKTDSGTDKSKQTQDNGESKTSTDFASDEIAKLNDYVKNGGSIDDFIRTQRADYSKISDLDALREAERLADPTLTDADITLLLEDKYGLPDGATDKEKRLKELQIKRDGVQAKKSLAENQKKWEVKKPSQDELNQQSLQWKNTLSTTTDNVNQLDIKLNETETFTYTVPTEAKGKIKSDYEVVANLFKKYINADGSENVELFVKDMLILNNFEAIIKAAAGFNKSKGKEEVIKDIKQTNFEAKPKTGDGSTKTIAQQAAEQMFGKR